METRDDLAEFRRRLTETIAWCAPRASEADPRHCLRSPELEPTPFGDDDQPFSERQASVEAVANRRAEILQQAGKYPSAQAQDLAGGRLLLYVREENLADALADAESRGFFDEEDTPPWDTWLLYYREPESPEGGVPLSYLVSWVPPPLLPLVDWGVVVDPEACITWADQRDTALTRRLREAGWFA